jgi:hypothetical protein
LVQNINAIAVFLDHALNSGDLAGDTFDPAQHLTTDLSFHI